VLLDVKRHAAAPPARRVRLVVALAEALRALALQVRTNAVHGVRRRRGCSQTQGGLACEHRAHDTRSARADDFGRGHEATIVARACHTCCARVPRSRQALLREQAAAQAPPQRRVPLAHAAGTRPRDGPQRGLRRLQYGATVRPPPQPRVRSLRRRTDAACSAALPRDVTPLAGRYSRSAQCAPLRRPPPAHRQAEDTTGKAQRCPSLFASWRAGGVWALSANWRALPAPVSHRRWGAAGSGSRPRVPALP
jgi:hypothetical protein